MLVKKLQGQVEKSKGIYYEYDAESTPLGEGGMGVVYKGGCVDEKTGVRTEVAIKALHDDLPEEVYARAEREASIQLRHDNLVEMRGLISVYESNKWGEPVYHHYVISELLHGIELSDLLIGKFDGIGDGEDGYARGLYANYVRDKEATSVFIIKSILSGVLALHDKGYIHRDIDPSNIMVTSDGCIKLIDFGIAKNLKALGSNDKLMTTAGKFIGKAEYASPELVLGDVRNQNYTTDIYALGILFYRLLVGRLPFEGSQYEILQKQLKHKIPVSYITNKSLAKVVKKATEKLQSRRYGSIAEFRVAIEVAEKTKPTLWDKGGKYVVMCLGLLAFGWGVWGYLEGGGNAISVDFLKSDYVDADTLTDFEYALGLLDSADGESVRSGFKKMKALADNGDDKAKVEIGITLFGNENNEIVSRRRSLLGKSKKSVPAELKETIKYLTLISDDTVITPDVYYILGAAYYQSNDDFNALSCWEKALALLNLNIDAVHGYDNGALKSNLEHNIDALREFVFTDGEHYE